MVRRTLNKAAGNGVGSTRVIKRFQQTVFAHLILTESTCPTLSRKLKFKSPTFWAFTIYYNKVF